MRRDRHQAGETQVGQRAHDCDQRAQVLGKTPRLLRLAPHVHLQQDLDGSLARAARLSISSATDAPSTVSMAPNRTRTRGATLAAFASSDAASVPTCGRHGLLDGGVAVGGLLGEGLSRQPGPWQREYAHRADPY